MEVLILTECATTDTRLYHYRQGREEIDLILESRAGDIAAIEVKAAATVRPRDYAALVKLREARGGHFKAGIVVYAGQQTVPRGRGGLHWPRRGGLKWPHFASVVVCVDLLCL
jgi:predicted AAA+ superfamily ATPase